MVRFYEQSKNLFSVEQTCGDCGKKYRNKSSAWNIPGVCRKCENKIKGN